MGDLPMADEAVDGAKTVQRGKLKITKVLQREGVRDLENMLPPDHHIVLESVGVEEGYVEWLIEGPDLPETFDTDAVPDVRLIVLIDRKTNSFRVKWQHRSDHEWIVQRADMPHDFL